MEALLDAADELAQEEQPDRPDFDIPDAYTQLAFRDPGVLGWLCLGDSTQRRGKGWFAARDLPAGTTVLVAKPIAMIMDWEDDVNNVNAAAAATTTTTTTDHYQDDAEEGEEGSNSNNNVDAVVAMEEDRDADDADYKDDSEVLPDDDDDDVDDVDAGGGGGDENDDEPEPRLNELLLLDILEALEHNHDLWAHQLSNLFPRTDEDLATLPAWVCGDDAIFMQVETFLGQLRASGQYSPELVQEISKRLPHIIRYNVLSVETCSELLSYPGPGGHASLSGVALYHYPSMFNHSARPNCSRWAIGDVMFFVTNQDISAGQEVCISYIEHDVLCESPYRRNLMLRMDFQDTATSDQITTSGNTATDPSSSPSLSLQPPQNEEKNGPEMPVVDPDVQNELMSMDPLERLSSLEELLLQATGEKLPDGEAASAHAPPPPDGELADESMHDAASQNSATPGAVTAGWFQCDVHNLRILQAITLDGLGQAPKALQVWEQAVAFCEQKLPPADESLVVVRTQAALCALQAGDPERAAQHARTALQTHNLLFGGGVAFFRRRLRRDLELPLRPSPSNSTAAANTATIAGSSPADVLWPL